MKMNGRYMVLSSSDTIHLFLQGDFKIGEPILHIELRRWADVVLVAPCSANTLAKIASGFCDNLAVSLKIFSPSIQSNPHFPSSLGFADFIHSDITPSCPGSHYANIYISRNEYSDV